MQNAITKQTADKHSAVFHRVAELTSAANQHFVKHMPEPQITFRASGSRAGTAFLQQHRVNFHRILLEHYFEAYIAQIIPHELAHILVYYHYGRTKPHGPEWQQVMLNIFGCDASVTHDLDLSVLERATWQYECGCQIHSLSTRRHNAIVKKKKHYYCVKCKQRLTAI